MIIEPTSAAALAAIDHVRDDHNSRDETIVCMLTGSGIKTMSEISKILS